jgi:hypothetical protein
VAAAAVVGGWYTRVGLGGGSNVKSIVVYSKKVKEEEDDDNNIPGHCYNLQLKELEEQRAWQSQETSQTCDDNIFH